MTLITRFLAVAMLTFVLAGSGTVACGESPSTGSPQGSSGTGDASAALPGSTKDWPQFRGPTGMGTSAEKPPVKWSASENIVWKVAMPGPGTSSPVIFGDRIYITCYTGYNVPGNKGDQADLKRHLLALNKKDGSTIWSQPLDAKLPEQDRIRDDHGYASSTPYVDKDRIYLFYGKTGALAYDHSGKKLWQTDVGDTLNGWGSAASPIVHKDLVIINASVESESVVALDKKTGEEKWRIRGVKESWNTPILVDVPGATDVKTELVFAKQGKILGVNPDTGKELWSCDTSITWYMVPSLVADKGVVYALGGRSGITSLAVKLGGRGDVTKSHRLWTSEKGSNVSSPIIHDGHLYWMNDSRSIAYCAKADTGKIVYEEPFERIGQVYGSPVLAGGNIYYTSRNGRSVVVPAKPEFELLSTNDLSDRATFNGSPAVADGRLFMRSDKFLYCIGEK